MKKIENIEIKNFKSIRHAEIKDCRRINVFIGYPNTGKSNILEALSLFSIDKPDANFDSFVRVAELTTLFFNGNATEKIEVRINSENTIFGTLRESNKISFSWLLKDRAVSKDYGILNFVKSENDKTVSNWDSIFKRQLRSDDFYKELGSGYLAAIKKYHFEKNLIFSSGKYDSLAVPYGENIFDIIKTNLDLKKEIEELFLSYDLELVYDQRIQKFIILKRDLSGVFSIPYELIADTLQRLIFYKAAIASNKESILLFEEPEAHMFPPYISKFTSDIMYDENNNQYFIATHSPFVLNDFMEDMEKDELAIYTVGYKKETGETLINRLTDEQVTEVYQYGVDLFFNLEDYLKDAVS